MTKARILTSLFIGALLMALLAPAGAQSGDPRAQRDAARSRRAQLASQLDGLKASEKELLDAAAVLDDQVLSQAARVDAARQAVAVAVAEVQDANNSLAETKSLIGQLEQLFVDRAVAEYMSPRGGHLDDLVETTDLAEAARKHALLDSIASTDEDALDELAAEPREDYEAARVAAEAAQSKASARQQESEAALAKLESDRAHQRKLQVAMTTRQREVLSEIDKMAASESALTRIINERARQTSAGSGSLPVGSGGCMWPARGRVTSEYGRRWGRMHEGIDIAAPTGTPIYAARAGTVIFSGSMSGYGNAIVIDHGGGFTTLYGHQSRLLVSRGASVDHGSRIGSIGNTGHSTGPHLHFETRYGGTPRNARGCLG